MGLMMWMMMRGSGGQARGGHEDAAREDLARLRAEVEQLRAARSTGAPADEAR
jgi:hypothetical protein